MMQKCVIRCFATRAHYLHRVVESLSKVRMLVFHDFDCKHTSAASEREHTTHSKWMVRWHCAEELGLVTGDCGFNPSHSSRCRVRPRASHLHACGTRSTWLPAFTGTEK